MKVEIVKFDNLGRGIGYIDDKIIFVPKSVPQDIVEVEKTIDKKNYAEGKIVRILKPAKLRKEPICPYFNICGGCDLMQISLSEQLEFKLNKINDYFLKHNINYKVEEIIKSEGTYNYRNKVSLKIINGEIGYYEASTHNLVKINYCHLIKECLNNLIKDLPLLNITNGLITLRCNYKEEILLIIDTLDELENIDNLINKHKIVGIVYNDKTLYGENYLTDKVNNLLFKISYNSFFQINPNICVHLFNLINDYTKDSKSILDLYCGVGSLSLNASHEDNQVLGVEVVKNAINDASFNKIFNQKNNVNFICDDTKNVLDKITKEIDTIILDPPRSGVNKVVIDKILEVLSKKIIYVSCNPITLTRDLNLLDFKYSIISVKLLDMFPNTQHVECVSLLCLKDTSKALIK